jgi:hypothetical protein
MDHERPSDHDLLSRATKLVGSHRRATAALVACLAEIEERRLHLRAGFGSMFEFCICELRLSEGEAFRRLLAARLARRFPVVVSRLSSGALHLSALELLREHLTDENHAELFEAADGKSKREVEALVASRFPRPDVPSRISRGHVEQLSAARFRVEFAASAELCEKLELCRDMLSHANPSRELGFIVERALDLLIEDIGKQRLARRGPRRARAQRGVREAGVGAERATCSEPPSFAARSSEPTQLFEVKQPSEAKPALETKRDNQRPVAVSRAVRREVFARDGLRCTFVGESGRRCGARAFLELDHVTPRALGGQDDASNVRVRCRAHNLLWADEVFGRRWIERKRHLCRQKSQQSAALGATRAGSAPRLPVPERTSKRENECVSASTFAPDSIAASVPSTLARKVRLALRTLGFREPLARAAIAKALEAHDASEHLELETLFREALLVATAA